MAPRKPEADHATRGCDAVAPLEGRVEPGRAWGDTDQRRHRDRDAGARPVRPGGWVPVIYGTSWRRGRWAPTSSTSSRWLVPPTRARPSW